MQAPLAKLTKDNQRLQTALKTRDDLKKQADDMKVLADNRFFWIVVFTDLRAVMMEAEAAEKANLTTPDNGGTNTEEGVWVEKFDPVMPDGYGGGMQSFSASPSMAGPSRYRGGGDSRSQRMGGVRPGMNTPTQVTATGMPLVVVPVGTVEVTNVVILCKGINRNSTTNSGLAFSACQFLTNSPVFTDPVKFGEFKTDEDTNTFTFEVTVNLRHRFKL